MTDFKTLRAQSCLVRLAADGYHVAAVSTGMNDREAYAALFAAAPDLLAAVKALLPEVDSEIEQRRTSGNDEYWQGLKALSDAGHAAVAKAEGRANA